MRAAPTQDPSSQVRKTALLNPNPTAPRKKNRFVQKTLIPLGAMLPLHGDLAPVSLAAARPVT